MSNSRRDVIQGAEDLHDVFRAAMAGNEDSSEWS